MASSDPYKVLKITRGSSMTDIKAAYYQQMKEMHPDVNPDRDTTDEAVQLNIAYTALLQEYLRKNPSTEEELDVFDISDEDATELFVNPFACYNANPLQWEELQEIARAAEGDDPEQALRWAGAGPGESAVVYLTPGQLRAVLDELERMGPAADPITLEACAFYLTDCLYRAQRTNSRARPVRARAV